MATHISSASDGDKTNTSPVRIRELSMQIEGRVDVDGGIMMPPHRYCFDHHPTDVTVLCREPLVCVLPQFMSPEECQNLMVLASSRFTRSLTGKGGNDKEEGAARTSSSAFFRKSEAQIIRTIEERAAFVTGYPIECIEGLQVVHYYPGQYYKPHWDSYNDKYPAARRAKGAGYDRIVTLLVYLNDVPCDGSTAECRDGTNGHTMMNLFSVTVPPQAGTALFWENTDSALRQYDAALHQGLPVCCHEKWAVNIWIHQRDTVDYEKFEDGSIP
eukprot:TRINITY_DN23797_c0_g1_i1.p1 TRINITY_DN23797_c0_g1~~TRINITY_DN23797_c0_g1_i1.p1  ORF type:complete len:272 (-),score=46.54 TRINITY_DN23797_c0_g1_i1:42-857(-)